MSSRHSPRLFVLLVGAALFAGACTTARMRVPGPLRGQSETWKVTQKTSWTRLRSLKMAGYVADDIDRTWTRSSRTTWLSSHTTVKRKQGYSFSFGAGDRHYFRVYCDARYSGETIRLGRTYLGEAEYVEGTTGLGCSVSAPDAPVGELRLAGMPRGVLRGDIYVGDVALGIRSLHRMEGSGVRTGEPTGYAFYEDGRMVAAVQRINDPLVYVVPDADERLRQAVAVAASTLIMYTPLDEGEDRH